MCDGVWVWEHENEVEDFVSNFSSELDDSVPTKVYLKYGQFFRKTKFKIPEHITNYKRTNSLTIVYRTTEWFIISNLLRYILLHNTLLMRIKSWELLLYTYTLLVLL